MYGSRGRIGLLIPANNVVIEPEFHQVIPEGVYAFSTRILGSIGADGDEGIRKLLHNAERGIEELLMAEVNPIVYCCLSTSLVDKNWNEAFEALVKRKRDDVGCFTAYTATVEAIKSLKVDRIAVLSAFTDYFNRLLIESFADDGIQVEKSINLNIQDVRRVGDLYPEMLVDKIKEVKLGGIQCFSILATDIRTFEIIDILEKDMGVPVITTNQAIFWKSMHLLGSKINLSGYGSLLRTT